MIRTRILAIDDDPLILELISDALADEYQVDTSTNAAAGLARLQKEVFDLLLLDLGLPEIDGFQVIRRVRSTPGLQRLPIVVISAFLGLGEQLRDADIQGIVRKPFRLALLYETLNRVLADQRQGSA